MNTTNKQPTPSADAGDWNIAIIRGRLTGPPSSRTLPDGTVIVDFDVATEDGTVPISWREPASATLSALQPGESVVVIGHVQRRFFRSGGRTHCRTEVVALRAIPSRRRAKVSAALAGVLSDVAP